MKLFTRKCVEAASSSLWTLMKTKDVANFSHRCSSTVRTNDILDFSLYCYLYTAFMLKGLNVFLGRQLAACDRKQVNQIDRWHEWDRFLIKPGPHLTSS